MVTLKCSEQSMQVPWWAFKKKTFFFFFNSHWVHSVPIPSTLQSVNQTKKSLVTCTPRLEIMLKKHHKSVVQ